MRFSKKHILTSLRTALSQGTTPRKLALTCALGIIVGIFPVWGTTTWICLGLAILFRLNMVIMQLINFLFFPIQLLLIIPFIKVGVWIFNLKPFPYNSTELIAMLQTDYFIVLKELSLSLAVGIGVWAVLAAPLFFIIFYVSYMVFSRWDRAPNSN